MVDNVKVMNQTKLVMDALFRYIDVNDITFFVYRVKDFPLMKTITEKIVGDFNTYSNRKTYYVGYLKGYKRNTKLIMFTLLLNDRNVCDITYQYNRINNFVKNNLKDTDIFMIKLNTQYTDYHEFVRDFQNSVQAYLSDRFKNKLEREDSNE